MFWLKSELILEKIRKTSDSLARRRRASESPASQDSQRPQKISEETGRRKFLTTVIILPKFLRNLKAGVFPRTKH